MLDDQNQSIPGALDGDPVLSSAYHSGCTDQSSCTSNSIADMVARNLEERARVDVLEDEIVTMAARLNAANYHMLKLLREFDELGGWQGDGIKSFAHWLNWKIGMGHMMAREKVRVARALPDLPMIDKAFSEGEVSYSKVRAMTRVATPENESVLLQFAEVGTAAHMEQTVKKYAMCQRLEDAEPDEAARREASVSWFQDDDGMVVINARLCPEEGALVLKALELEVDRIKREKRSDRSSDDNKGRRIFNEMCNETSKETVDKASGETKLKVDSNNVSAETFSKGANLEEVFMTARASALTHVAEAYLLNVSSSDGEGHLHGQPHSLGDHYQVFLHLNANTASDTYSLSGRPTCDAEQKHFIAPAVAKRLACDASVTTVLEDDHGNVLNIGRRSRTIPRAIKHALRIRDNGCRFPGCHQQHYTDAHHIQHWMNGGETSLDNLVTLCRFHHTQLHKGEYTLDVSHPARDKHSHQDLQQKTAPPELIFRNKQNQVIEVALYPQFPPQRGSTEQIAKAVAQSLVKHPVTRHTAECKWTGEVMDYSLAINALSTNTPHAK